MMIRVALLLLYLIAITVATAPEIYTTAKCEKIRKASFQGRLDLHYFYMIQFKGEIVLESIERALATTLATNLDACNEDGYARYGLQVDDRHVFAAGDSPCPQLLDSGTSCRVVRGITQILLDSGSPNIETEAFDIIEQLVDDASLLASLTGIKVLHSSFLRSIGGSFVILGSDGETAGATDAATNTKVAVLASFAAFFSGILLFYILYRARSIERFEGSVKAHVHHIKEKRRGFFRELCDDGSEYPTLHAITPEGFPSITWSVSDLTNDSQSIKSSLPLDRIDEDYLAEDEGSEHSYDEENAIGYGDSLDYEFAYYPGIDDFDEERYVSYDSGSEQSLREDPNCPSQHAEVVEPFELQECWLSYQSHEKVSATEADEEVGIRKDDESPDSPRTPTGCRFITEVDICDEDTLNVSNMTGDQSFETAILGSQTYFISHAGTLFPAGTEWLCEILAQLERSKEQKLLTLG